MAARRSAFSSRNPLAHDESLELRQTGGPLSFLNPTQAHFAHVGANHSSRHGSTADAQTDAASGTSSSTRIAFRWRARDNRKGRHALAVDPSLPTLTPSASKQSTNSALVVPARTTTTRAIGQGIWRMLTVYPYWDVSWLVAVIFTLGSCLWVVNAFFVWLPLVQPATEFDGETVTGGGWTAFVGATIFEIGSVLLMLEAVNENRTGCFGWALERAVHDAETGAWHVRPRGASGCAHHHVNRRNFVGKPVGTAQAGTSSAGSSEDEGGAHKENGEAETKRGWQWFPSWHELRTHYFYELGFIACSAQMLGATVFWISGFTAIPQIYDMLPDQVSVNFGYWIPQIVGGTGFIVSGALFMLETQRRWYIPAFGTLGWHIGLWNLIGAFGFTLCGALGPAYANQGAQFEASLATFWGSWAFLIGSVVQWYESLDKYPVESL